MDDENLDEELNILYREPERMKVLNSDTFRLPVGHLKVRKPVMLDVRQSVKEAINMMEVKQFGCVLVTRSDALAGILTERDIILKALNTGLDPDSTSIETIMTPNPESVEREESIAVVMNAMHVGGYRHVPVVDEHNIPVAVVSVKDIIGFIVENFSEEVLNVPPHPLRHSDTQDGG
ncbi:MAG TPA: CBS domain-containing protein [Bacteroidota bacterium]|jgi:CBS domain-containing protein|nr:CBS domain-containing protein [Bacteroidota bacterium]